MGKFEKIRVKMKLATFFISSVFSYSPVTDVKRLFEKFDTRMSRCKNGPQTDALSSVSLHGFSTGNLNIVEDQWMNLFRNSFNNCDWPIRIRSVIAAFRKAYN